jgi:deazaflavin-dependent oxidoreductase (nitroreductase family)
MAEQQDSGLMTYPASGWHRLAFKAPITLWRLGLGPLVGRALMLLTTWGRKSGLPRRTVIEYHALAGTKYAPSAFGARSDWYQNLQADPYVTIQTSDGVEHTVATRVTGDDELVRVYNLFMRRNPVMLRWYLDALGIAADPDEVVEKKQRIHWLRFDPTSEGTPPPLVADLAWVWLVVGLIAMALWRPIRRHR